MKRPLTNILSLSASDVGGRFIGFLITIYLARILEPSAFGVMNIGMAVLSYLMLIASPGVQVLETRNAAASNTVDEERVGAVLSMRLALAVALCLLSWFVLSLLVGASETRDVILLFVVSLVPLALLLDWFFQGRERFELVGMIRLTQYIVYGVSVVLLVRSGDDVRFAAVAFGVGNLAAAFLTWRLYQKHVGSLRMKWQPRIWKSVYTENIPVGFAMFVGQSAINLPAIIIGVVLTSTDVGLFSAAMKFIFVVLMLDRILNALFLPVATRYFNNRLQDVEFLIGITLKTVLVVAFPLTVCGIVAAPMAIGLVFGEGYVGATVLLQILMGFFFLTLMNSILVCAMIGSGRERAYVRVMTVSAFCFVVSVVLLILVAGTQGAAWGVVLGELLTVVLMFLEVRKFVRVPVVERFGRTLVACALMGVTAWLLREAAIVLKVIGPMIVFGVTLLFVGGLTKEEIRFLKGRFV